MGIRVNVWVKSGDQNIEVPAHYEQVACDILGSESSPGVSILVPDPQEGYQFVRILGQFPEWTMIKESE